MAGSVVRAVAMFMVPVGIAACSSHRGNIRATLHAFGVSQKASACAADTLQDRLSGQQLQTLVAAVRQPFAPGELSMAAIEKRVRSTNDPAIVAAAEAAGAGCFLTG